MTTAGGIRRVTSHGVTPGRMLRPKTKVLPEHARGHNRSLVLQTLYRDGSLSRADLARSTGLTRVTVSDLVAELIGERLVVERGPREGARPGKPAVLVDIDRSAFAIIGVDLSDHRLFRGAVLDLGGAVLVRDDVPLQATRGEDALGRVLALVERLVAAASAPVLGIGVGSPGIVDLGGVVREAPNLGWTDLPLQETIAARTGLPVVVANDANVAVLAEHGYGDADGDMMLIAVGHGVGAGLLVGGSLVYGSRFAAGEIGQVIVGDDDGTLEDWLAVPRLQARLDAAPATDREAVLREAGRRLGIALAPVIGALDLSEVVLSGPPALLDGPLAASALATVHARTMTGFHGHVTLRLTAQGTDIVLRGAAVLVLAGQLGVS
jgi:predicted NBD/HSP70 family sugar kinase